MESESQQKRVFGWLILGVWAGVVIGDAIAVIFYIRTGHVDHFSSATTKLIAWSVGAFIGFLFALPFDLISKQSPKRVLWTILYIVSLAYWFLIRIPFEMGVR